MQIVKTNYDSKNVKDYNITMVQKYTVLYLFNSCYCL